MERVLLISYPGGNTGWGWGGGKERRSPAPEEL